MPEKAGEKVHILVVDDDPGQRSLLESFLTGHGFTVVTAASGSEALNLLDQDVPTMLISDVRMPGMSGLDLLKHVRKNSPMLPVLLVTAYADIRDAVGAMRGGAVNYLEKPIDLDELLRVVQENIEVEQKQLPSSKKEHALPEGVVAQSPEMADVLRQVALVAPSETRVLITGESGAGKEVVADIIHAWSPRAKASVVKINCAAIPETLLESELFGHKKGAFTGATDDRIGLFERANGGTIFLDEIGEMSPALQAKLLRVIQDGTYLRVGSNDEHHNNARILAATNRNLEEEIKEGRFREDLFYRLNVMEIFLPPLRERKDDILPLATCFAAEFGQIQPRFSPDATSCLEAYTWPGNIRELRNAIERAVLLACGEIILPQHLPKKIYQDTSNDYITEDQVHSTSRMAEIERTAILKALKACNYNRTETSRTLGISRRALTYKLRRYREQGFAIDPD